MRRLFRAAAASGVGAGAGVVLAVVRVKLFALFLGAAGVGLVSQLINFHTALTTIAALGLGVGVSKAVAEARTAGDLDRVRRIAWTALCAVTAGGLALTVAAALFARPVASMLFSGPTAWALVLWSAPTILFLAIGRTLADLTAGIRDVRTMMWSGVLGALFALVCVSILVPGFGLRGAVIGLPLVALISVCVTTALLAWRQNWVFLPRPSPLFDSSLFAGLGKVGLASLAMGFSDQFALLVVRSDLIHRYGPAANGHFQGSFGLFQQLFAVSIAFHYSYSFPKVNEARSDAERNKETLQALKMTMILLGGGAAMLVLARHLLVRVLLSRDFLDSLPLFPWQGAGDFARGSGLALGLALLARAGLRRWTALGLGMSASFVVLSYLLRAPFGPAAPSVAWCAAGFLYLAATLSVMMRLTGLRLKRREGAALLTAAPLFAALAWIADGTVLSYALGLPMIAAWLALPLRPREWRSLFGGASSDEEVSA